VRGMRERETLLVWEKDMMRGLEPVILYNDRSPTLRATLSQGRG